MKKALSGKIVPMTPEEFDKTGYGNAIMAVPCGIWKNERLMFGVAHRYDDFYGDELGFQPFFYYATPKRLQEEIDGVLDTVSERGNRKVGIVVMMNSELYKVNAFENP